MDTPREWKGYRLNVLDTSDMFSFIKNHIVSYIDQHNLRFWVTFYRGREDPHPHLQFRVYVDSIERQNVEEYLDNLVKKQIILSREPATHWDPGEDASNRLTGFWKRIEKIRDKSLCLYAGRMRSVESILDSQLSEQERIEELGALFGAIGAATKAFYKALPRKPKDPLITSIAIHILLNSLTYSGPDPGSEEEEIRLTPP